MKPLLQTIWELKSYSIKLIQLHFKKIRVFILPSKNLNKKIKHLPANVSFLKFCSKPIFSKTLSFKCIDRGLNRKQNDNYKNILGEIWIWKSTKSIVLITHWHTQRYSQLKKTFTKKLIHVKRIFLHISCWLENLNSCQ